MLFLNSQESLLHIGTLYQSVSEASSTWGTARLGLIGNSYWVLTLSSSISVCFLLLTGNIESKCFFYHVHFFSCGSPGPQRRHAFAVVIYLVKVGAGIWIWVFTLNHFQWRRRCSHPHPVGIVTSKKKQFERFPTMHIDAWDQVVSHN